MKHTTRPARAAFILTVVAVEILLALGLVTCANTAQASFKGESKMRNNPRLRADFAFALRHWGIERSDIVGPGKICKSLRVETESSHFRGAPWAYGAFDRDYYGHRKCNLLIKWRMYRCRARAVTIHEVGHAVLWDAFRDDPYEGFYLNEITEVWMPYTDPFHSPDRNHLMYPVLYGNYFPQFCPWQGEEPAAPATPAYVEAGR